MLEFPYIKCYCLSRLERLTGSRFFRFPYIKCYCLSKPGQRKQIIIWSFHTSNVTVYLNIFCHYSSRNGFPYIKCYCLSFEAEILSGELTAFPYIKCYCLSI